MLNTYGPPLGKGQAVNKNKNTLGTEIIPRENIPGQTLNQGLRDGRWIGLLRDYFKAVTASSIGSQSLSGRNREEG